MSFNDLIAGLEKEVMKDQGSTGSTVQYLKTGENYVIKFVMPKGKTWNPKGSAEDNKFWAVIDDLDANKNPTKSFLIPGVIIRADNEKAVDKETVKYIKIKATALKAIIKKLEADWDIFADEGAVMVCKPLKAQPWFSIEGVMKGKKAEEFDSSNVVYPEISLEEAAKLESAKVNVVKSDKINPDAEEDDLPF